MAFPTINQRLFDSMAFCQAGCAGDDTDISTLQNIRRVIKNNFGIVLSNTEAHKYWTWHSHDWDAGFLTCGTDEEIVKYFEQYVRDYFKDDYEDIWYPYEENK